MACHTARRLAYRQVGLATLALYCLAAYSDTSVLKNWFNDPFFPLSADLSHCPTPRGPLLTESEMKAESHSRIERGTSCWMAGQCAQPNAYLYDVPIAQAIHERFARDGALSAAMRGTALWVTVKRRFVWIEGCVKDKAQVAAAEAAVRRIPDVEQVLVNVMQDTGGRPPYRSLAESPMQ